MRRPAVEQGVMLFETRGTAPTSGPAGRVAAGESLAEVDPDGHAHVMVVRVVSEASGHAGTLNVGRDDVEPETLQHRDRR
jgi:hypothetical protein